ncbi:hypothetical protein WR25_09988 [Diploscapter pachys]|uniref:HORMA domain-containing protein n=1 Tax=Diploscapter pachys TaxID=2018661 RepID=A0A2A2KFH3_9BILA|nr:hypothetical protein WR25_09988 [Diploscapter pachys]
MVFRGYMDELFLVVSQNKEKPDEAIEVYRWKMHYDQDGDVSAEFGMTGKRDDLTHKLARLEYKGAEQVRLSTIALIFAIRKLCKNELDALPGSCVASFRMTYTLTPSNYMAPGFHGSHTLYNFPEKGKAQTALVGKVRTKVHGFALTCESTLMKKDAFDTELNIMEISDKVFDSSVNDRDLDNSLYTSIVGGDINNITGQTMGDNTSPSPVGTPEAPRDEDMHKEDGREKESEEDSDDLSRKRKRQSELGGQGQRRERGLAKKPRQQEEDGSHSDKVTTHRLKDKKRAEKEKQQQEKESVEVETSISKRTPKKVLFKTHIIQQFSPQSEHPN